MVENTYLDELKETRFSSLPWTDKEELTLDGKKIYTSLGLKENVKKVSKKYLPKIASVIIKLIDDGKLIPVFVSKNIIDYIFKQRKKIKSHSLATTRGDKIYIFLDTMYSLLKLSSVNEKFLAKLIVHELIHLADHKQPKKFFQINYKYYIEFYKEFFSNYLSIEKITIQNNVIDGIFKRQLVANKKGIVNFRNIYIQVFKILEKESAFNEVEYQELFDEFIEYLDSIYEGFSTNVPTRIWEAGRLAYLKITGGKNETLAQEFWNPSEIICIMSELYPQSANIIKSIDLLK